MLTFDSGACTIALIICKDKENNRYIQCLVYSHCGILTSQVELHKCWSRTVAWTCEYYIGLLQKVCGQYAHHLTYTLRSAESTHWYIPIILPQSTHYVAENSQLSSSGPGLGDVRAKLVRSARNST